MIGIGISGWSYPQWRGGFYPRTLPLRDALAYASRRFATIEINATFYGRQPAARYDRWHELTPPGFLFAVKGLRQVTHHRRLADAEEPLAAFFASGVLRLKEKLGPILWQLPPGLAFDPALVEQFVIALPRDSRAAARLAAIDGVDERPLRHAIEVRHPSFETPRFLDLLRRHDVALVFADGPSAPRFREPTAALVYVRLHGTGAAYTGGYDAAALDGWAALIKDWAGGASRSDVLVYFNNTMKGDAPADAEALARRLGGVRAAQMASS